MLVEGALHLRSALLGLALFRASGLRSRLSAQSAVPRGSHFGAVLHVVQVVVGGASNGPLHASFGK